MTEKTYPLPMEAAKEGARVMATYLKARRIALKLSQEELAARIEVTKSTVSKMESNQFDFGTRLLIRWCYALGCNPHIVSKEEEPPGFDEAFRRVGTRV